MEGLDRKNSLLFSFLIALYYQKIKKIVLWLVLHRECGEFYTISTKEETFLHTIKSKSSDYKDNRNHIMYSKKGNENLVVNLLSDCLHMLS